MVKNCKLTKTFWNVLNVTQPLHEHSKHNQGSSSVVEQLPYKSPGTAALIALIGGLFGILGIGHIYVGKLGKGIGILILGIVLVILQLS